MWARLKRWAKEIENEGLTLWFACRHPDMPLVPRILALLVVAYFMSPIDLIPDFIPVLGYVDDLIIVPLGVWLVLSLIPKEIMAEYRAVADEAATRPRSNAAAITIVAIWILGAATLGWIGFARWGRSN